MGCKVRIAKLKDVVATGEVSPPVGLGVSGGSVDESRKLPVEFSEPVPEWLPFADSFVVAVLLVSDKLDLVSF